jgi:membrane-associated phospholipid phosphatase
MPPELTRTLPERPLGFYSRMAAAGFAIWLVYFLAVGNLAATLPTRDLRTAWDLAIPLWEWSVWIYDFCYLIPVFAIFAIKDGHLLNRLLVAIYTATLLATVVYFLIPISYPDPVFSDSISGRFLAWQFEIDFQPGANKMPSLHVANAFMVWLAVRNRGRIWSQSYLIVAILIALSTLVTKKHLIADAALGTVWAFGAWYLSGRIYNGLFDQSLPPKDALLGRIGLLKK